MQAHKKLPILGFLVWKKYHLATPVHRRLSHSHCAAAQQSRRKIFFNKVRTGQRWTELPNWTKFRQLGKFSLCKIIPNRRKHGTKFWQRCEKSPSIFFKSIFTHNHPYKLISNAIAMYSLIKPYTLWGSEPTVLVLWWTRWPLCHARQGNIVAIHIFIYKNYVSSYVYPGGILSHGT
jgi:hypothetical protein